MEDIIIDVLEEKEIEVRFIKRWGDLASTREKAGWERRHEEMDGPLRAVPCGSTRLPQAWL